MRTYTRRVIIVPAAGVPACNDALEAAGFGPTNVSRKLNAQGNTAVPSHCLADWTDHEGHWPKITPIVLAQSGATITEVHPLYREKEEGEKSVEDVLEDHGLKMREND